MYKEKGLNIDPEEFAYHLMDSITLDQEHLAENLEGLAKKKLMAYLTGYYLIENFNEFEQEIIEEAKTNHELDLQNLTYGELMKKISNHPFF